MCHTRYTIATTLKEQTKLPENIINNLNKTLYTKIIKYTKLKERNLIRLLYAKKKEN